VPWDQAAAFPVPALTAAQALREVTTTTPDGLLLINGAGGVLSGRGCQCCGPVTLAAIGSHRGGDSDALSARDGELELIREFLNRSAAHGDALVVLGEPGVGKTALLRAADEMEVAAGGRVLTAAGVESEADVTFSGLHEAVLPLYDEISELTDSYREALTVALGFGDGAPPDRLRVATATLTLLMRAASSAPLLQTVDDLPWLNRPSAVVLSIVARRLRGSRVAMLGTSRSGEESFFERAGLRTVELGPLSNDVAGQPMSAHFPTLVPAVRARLLAEAEGNPLVVLELPAALSDRERTSPGASARASSCLRRYRTDPGTRSSRPEIAIAAIRT
jgi:AAA ATPase domain